MSESGFLRSPEITAGAQELFDEDMADLGYVMNVSKLWAYQPSVLNGLFALAGEAVAGRSLSFRQRGILVVACASTMGDSYCSLAWGTKLAGASDAETAASVLRGDDEGLSDDEKALAGWARKVAHDPNGTSAEDVQALRDAGFLDEQIFAITAYVAFRLAFSTVNDALGARPDGGFRLSAPAEVVDAVTFGRPIDDHGRD
jgi:uncharacterized peroxidase-related enzyme